jgi:hypothetical protein
LSKSTEALRVSEQDEILAKHTHGNRLVRYVFALFRGIPEINEHAELLQTGW